MKITPVQRGVMVQAFDGAVPFYLRTAASCELRHEWYRGCYFAEETARGLDDREDHLCAALFRAKLEVGSSITLVITTEANTLLDGETALAERVESRSEIIPGMAEKFETLAADAPSWLWQLIRLPINSL